MDKSNIHPELQMQQMLQLDLLLRPANLTRPVPTWHGVPSQVNYSVKKNPHNQSAKRIYKTASGG